MARSDHCRCVSTPRCRRASSKVTSTCQRRTNQARICSAGSRDRCRAAPGCRTRPGVADQHPADAAPAAGPCGTRPRCRRRSRLARPLPIPVRDDDRRPGRAGSAESRARVGRRWPFLRGRPVCPARRGVSGFIQRGVQPQPGDHGDRVGAAGTREQLDGGIAAIGDHHQRASGSQRRSSRSSWRAQSVSFLWRRPAFR